MFVPSEIERKWLVQTLPDAAALGAGEPLRQGYLARDGDVEVRVRITTGRAVLTVKAGHGLVRSEVEVDVDPEAAEELWPHCGRRQLEKVRHRVALGGLTAEVDLFGGSLRGLATVDVEFPSEAAAVAFTPPDWFGRELTGDRAWSNASLAENGPPPES